MRFASPTVSRRASEGAGLLLPVRVHLAAILVENSAEDVFVRGVGLTKAEDMGACRFVEQMNARARVGHDDHERCIRSTCISS